MSELLNVAPHVLRYWETEFSILKPKKTKRGQRAYRRKDVDLLLDIRRLLYREGYTIEGARRQLSLLRRDGRRKRSLPELWFTSSASNENGNAPTTHVKEKLLKLAQKVEDFKSAF